MKHLSLLLLALLGATPAFAAHRHHSDEGDSAPEIRSDEGATKIKWSFGASADLQGQYFPDATQSPPLERKFGILNGELDGSMKVGHGFLVKVRPTGHWDPNNPTPNERSWYDLPEGYLQLKGSVSESTAYTMQLGFNTFTWGVTDGYNPVDIVSARRYNDPIFNEKLGAFSLLGRLDFGFLLLEGIYIPWQRESQLPGEKSRWLPRELGGPIQYAGAVTDLPSVPDYSFAEPISYDAALKNNFGARASSHFLGMDAAAYFFDGAATLPAVSYQLDVTATAIDPSTFNVTHWSASPHVTLRPIYNRVTVTGASVVFPIWELIVRSELAVTKAYRKGSPAITEQDTEGVAEVEHTFSGEKSTFTVIGLAAYSDPQDNGLQTSDTPTLNRLFDRAAGGGFRWQPEENTSVDTYAAFDVKHGGSLYNAQLTYKLSDAWKAYGGGQVFQGKSSQPVGVYRHNSRVIAGLKLAL